MGAVSYNDIAPALPAHKTASNALTMKLDFIQYCYLTKINYQQTPEEASESPDIPHPEE